MFAKRITEITLADIQRLIDDRVQEDAAVELKGDLATRDGAPDVWHHGAQRIGNEAKRGIAKELIAFANADGGTLILGVHEDQEKRAASIAPLPACRNLADRLAASVASSTDPRLTSIEYAGVEAAADGSGVVVFRVPQSHRAPHRDRDSRECYFRVGDRSEPMAMRQIQDLTMQRARGLEQVQRSLDDRSTAFSITLPDADERLPRSDVVVQTLACGARATAIPLEEVFVERIQDDRRFHFRGAQMLSRNGRGQQDQLTQLEHLDWSPILRGIRVSSRRDDDRQRSERIISSTGMIENSFQSREWINTSIIPSPKGFPTWWIMRTFAHTIITAEAFRVRYGRPELEYALDFEWRLPRGAEMLLPDNRYWPDRSVSPVEPTNRVANYEMPPRAGLPRLFEMLHADVGSSCGIRLPYVYQIDFDAAVDSILGN